VKTGLFALRFFSLTLLRIFIELLAIVVLGTLLSVGHLAGRVRRQLDFPLWLHPL